MPPRQLSACGAQKTRYSIPTNAPDSNHVGGVLHTTPDSLPSSKVCTEIRPSDNVVRQGRNSRCLKTPDEFDPTAKIKYPKNKIKSCEILGPSESITIPPSIYLPIDLLMMGQTPPCLTLDSTGDSYTPNKIKNNATFLRNATKNALLRNPPDDLDNTAYAKHHANLGVSGFMYIGPVIRKIDTHAASHPPQYLSGHLEYGFKCRELEYVIQSDIAINYNDEVTRSKSKLLIFSSYLNKNDQRRLYDKMRAIGYIPSVENLTTITKRVSDLINVTRRKQEWVVLRRLYTVFNNAIILARERYEILEKIRTRLNERGRRALKNICINLFACGMYCRRWAGPGTPYPISEQDTTIRITPQSLSVQLRNAVLDNTMPADLINEGRLDNMINYHLDLVLGHMDILNNNNIRDWLLFPVSTILGMESKPIDQLTFMRRTQKRNQLSNPNARHTALVAHLGYQNNQAPYMTGGSHLRNLVINVRIGRECIRMASAVFVLTAIALHHNLIPKRKVNWTEAEADKIILQMSRVA